MTPESDNFETHLRALADTARATQAKKVTAVQQSESSDESKARIRRLIELREDERRIENEALL